MECSHSHVSHQDHPCRLKSVSLHSQHWFQTTHERNPPSTSDLPTDDPVQQRRLVWTSAKYRSQARGQHFDATRSPCRCGGRVRQHFEGSSARRCCRMLLRPGESAVRPGWQSRLEALRGYHRRPVRWSMSGLEMREEEVYRVGIDDDLARRHLDCTRSPELGRLTRSAGTGK